MTTISASWEKLMDIKSKRGTTMPRASIGKVSDVLTIETFKLAKHGDIIMFEDDPRRWVILVLTPQTLENISTGNMRTVPAACAFTDMCDGAEDVLLGRSYGRARWAISDIHKVKILGNVKNHSLNTLRTILTRGAL